MNEPSTGAQIIPFPLQLRVVPIEEPRPERQVPELVGLLLVEHNGQPYALAHLLQRLSPDELSQVEATLPWTGQEAWDEIVRRWPAMAAEIVAVTVPA